MPDGEREWLNVETVDGMAGGVFTGVMAEQSPGGSEGECVRTGMENIAGR